MAISFLLLLSTVSVSAITPGTVYDVYLLNISVKIYSERGEVPPGFLNVGVPINLTMDGLSQHVFIINSSAVAGGIVFNHYDVERDEDENVGVVFSLDKNYSVVEINVTSKIYVRVRPPPKLSLEESGGLGDIPEQVKSRYLSENDAWVIDDDIKTVARALLDPSNVLRTILNYATWIDENILYPYEPAHLEPWNSTRTLHRGEGDCDDRAVLLIAMARSVGIPAYLQVGGIYGEYEDTITAEEGRVRYRLIDVGWHGWAMVYIPPWGWLAVDLTFFKGANIRFVARNGSTYFRINTDDPLNHIVGAALYTENVFILGNVATIDYIGPFKEWVKLLHTYGIFWIERNELIYQGMKTLGYTGVNEVREAATMIVYTAYALIGVLLGYKLLKIIRRRIYSQLA